MAVMSRLLAASTGAEAKVEAVGVAGAAASGGVGGSRRRAAGLASRRRSA
jgi:hypothetical protein